MEIHDLPDRYDALRREWIAEHAGVWPMQKRRAELLNRQIRKRVRMTAGARPNPHDDNVIHPLWARSGSTLDLWLERIVVVVSAVVAPIGWPLGLVIYRRLVELIPDRLRAYPIPALLWSAVATGVVPALLYSPDGSFKTAFIAPYLLAQVPAAFASAGIAGILNGWLAVDGSATWWPLTPPPVPVDFDFAMEADDVTAPSVFETADPTTDVDLSPATQIIQSGQPTRLVWAAVSACVLGSVWVFAAVLVGIKNTILDGLLAGSL